LAFDLVVSDVKFIRRHANEVTHSFTIVTLHHTSFHIYIKNPFFISSIVMNEMQEVSSRQLFFMFIQ